MFEFERELKRILGRTLPGESITPEPDLGLYELMDLTQLLERADALESEAGDGGPEAFAPRVQAARVWNEYARRTGDTVALRKAAGAAETAGATARTGSQAALAARLQTDICLLSYDLFETAELVDSAGNLLAQARAGVDPALTPGLDAAFSLSEARLMTRRARREGTGAELEPALEAMARIDRAVEKYDHLVRRSGGVHHRIEAAHARIERGDLLSLVGLDRQDSRLLAAVVTELKALRLRFDPDYEPLTRARLTQRLALAQIHMGQIDGEAERVSEAIDSLGLEGGGLSYAHSPLDWLAHTQTLALGLQVLAELTQAEDLCDEAVALYDMALEKPLRSVLSLRARLMSERAACLTRRAEMKGDRQSLTEAEDRLRDELKALDAEADPVGWAVLQVHLARLYVLRGDLSGASAGRTEIAYALEAAREIFAAFSLRALTGLVDQSLMRVRR